MTHPDHVRLIEKGLRKNRGGVWADFGSGEGAFTLALRDIVGSHAELYSIDKNSSRLQEQEKQFEVQFPGTNIHFLQENFMRNLHLPQFDGLIAANAIHFERDTVATIKHLAKYLKRGGKFIVVEYNVDFGNQWVPYPFSFKTFTKLAEAAGLDNVELLDIIPSTFLDEIYAAKAIK